MAEEAATADPVMAKIMAAVERGRAGETGLARAQLDAIWQDLGTDGDAFHRVVLAHYAADVQEDVASELAWDLAALRAADEVTDERAKQHHASLAIAGFYPSLHLNLAEDHRKLGEPAEARRHIAAARECLPALGDDGYGATIRTAVDRVAARLDAGDVSGGQGPVTAERSRT